MADAACIFSNFDIQLSDTDNDNTLAEILTEERWQTLLLDTGYRKPLAQVHTIDLLNITRTLRNFYTIIRVKPEIDQLLEGLSYLKVLEYIKKYPDIFLPLFQREECQLTKGA